MYLMTHFAEQSPRLHAEYHWAEFFDLIQKIGTCGSPSQWGFIRQSILGFDTADPHGDHSVPRDLAELVHRCWKRLADALS